MRRPRLAFSVPTTDLGLAQACPSFARGSAIGLPSRYCFGHRASDLFRTAISSSHWLSFQWTMVA